MNTRSICSWGFVAASCLLGQATGSIQGSLIGDDATVLAGASVYYHRVYATTNIGHGQIAPAPGEAVVDSSATSGTAGNFVLENLPVGAYVLCVEAASTPHLNPCKWSAPISVTVTANAAASQAIVLKRGVFLKTRVNDPLLVLPQTADSPFGGGPLTVGVVFGTGAFLGAGNTLIEAAGRDYQMAVPAGVPLKLWLRSSRFILLDGAGAVANPLGWAAIPFQAAVGVDQTFTFSAQRVQLQ